MSSRLNQLINREVSRINKRRGKRKVSKRKASKRKVSKRKVSKRKVSKRKASKRKVSKRKASKRKASKRKVSKRKASSSYRYMVKKGTRWVFATEARYKRAAPTRRKRVTVKR